MEKIQEIKEKINFHENMLSKFKDELEEHILILQKNCTHEEFWADPDGDYHKPGFYYSCKTCGIWYNSKPKEVKIEYRR